MGKSKIEWTENVWNPVVGCTKISKGCQNCYAEKMACRLAYMGQYKYQAVTTHKGVMHISCNKQFQQWSGEVFCDESVLDQPLHWRKPRRIFVCSMGDLFHEKVDEEFRYKVLRKIIFADWHNYIIATKRPEIAAEVLEKNKLLYYCGAAEIPNITLLVSVENQEAADKRIYILLKIGTVGKIGVSVEPMLENINLLSHLSICHISKPEKSLIDWVIIGCESIGRRTGRLRETESPQGWMETVDDGRYLERIWCENAVKIAQQCQRSGTKVFIKQVPINGKVERDIKKFPKELQTREYPECAKSLRKN